MHAAIAAVIFAATLFAMGRLASVLQAREDAARARFHDAFRRFARRGNQSRFRQLLDGRP